MTALKETLVDIINKAQELPESEEDTLNDVLYIRKSSALIVDALRKGYDVMQMPGGDIITTGMETVVYRYIWEKDKAKLVRSKVESDRLAAPGQEASDAADNDNTSETEASLKDSLAQVLEAGSSESDDEVLGDVRYIRKSSGLIVDALQKGYDIMQMPSGDIIATGMETVSYRYAWDKDKSRLVKSKLSSDKLQPPAN